MKSLHLNMYKKINYIAAVLVLFTGITAQAQVTSQSPYSEYGLGNVKPMVLPQLRAMGGISSGVFKPNGYNNINMLNPSTYSGINMATVDIGMSGTFTQLKQGSLAEKSFNASLNHIALAFPIKSGKSGISFGLMPYTQVGYEYTKTGKVDTSNSTSIYSGEGGLSKAYLGFGQQIGDHFRIGANVEYIFGNLVKSSSIELERAAAKYSREQDKNSIGGVNFSYGAQYEIPLGTKKRITFGYSGSASSSINSKRTYLASQYIRNGEDEGSFIDTLSSIEGKQTKLKLPLTHSFGFTIQRDNKWLFGADYRMGGWKKLAIDGVNQGLQDSWGVSAGGQYTPDISSIGSYFKRVDYRLGFMYDKTYIQRSGQDIKQQAITFGFGLPLAPSRYSVYKLNFTTEIGQRGTLTNGLVKENYINFHIGFTLNDTWFVKNKLY
ncbi:hypothetical protein [Pedobacter steynii]|uniref:Long-chain fatty acid transport protein n=1 Tax=Pedobacter steynii TaxID=430522 RepID=A0A1D7QDY8_9SPHI|nr:hypothetical protein [Pedobacter steynii]AOM76877.1 hypothetical protein BFS30_06660 [Pedobacter steynii]